MDLFQWEGQVPEGQGVKQLSEEEISKYAVDEQLPELERAVLYLTQGLAVQQRKAIDSLPALLKARGRAAFDVLREPLEAALDGLDADAEVAAAEAWAVVARERRMQPLDLAECLLPPALAALKDSREDGKEVCEAWVSVLCELLPSLGRDAVLREVVPLALSKGQVDESVASRVLCCRLLGAATPWLKRTDVEASYGAKMVALCQDTDYQVRVAACQQLPALARCLGEEGLRRSLVEVLAQLLEDEEVQVRAAALVCLADVLQWAGPELRAASLLPLIRKHMQPLELELPVQRALAGLFPAILGAVRDCLANGDTPLFYSCFRHLAARPDAELRRACAAQLLALMRAPLPGATHAYFHDTWADMAADHDDQVRALAVGAMADLASLMPPTDAARLVRKPLAAALMDERPAVRDAALGALAPLLGALAAAEEPQREALGAELQAALVRMQAGLGCNWRAQLALARAFPALPALLSADAVHEFWTPFAFSLLVGGAHRVKPAAAAGVAAFLRAARRDRQRTETYCRAVRELARGRSCWARLGFLEFAAAAARRFSARFFKDYLLDITLELLSDPVPNVRLAAAGLLPALKQSIRLPEDVEQLEALNSAMSNLMTDNDRDVSSAARAVHDAFKRTPLRMGGSSGGGLLDLAGGGGASSSGTSSSGGGPGHGGAAFGGGFGANGLSCGGGAPGAAAVSSAGGCFGGGAAAAFGPGPCWDPELSDKAKEEGESDILFCQDEMEKLRIDLYVGAAERRAGRRLAPREASDLLLSLGLGPAGTAGAAVPGAAAGGAALLRGAGGPLRWRGLAAAEPGAGAAAAAVGGAAAGRAGAGGGSSASGLRGAACGPAQALGISGGLGFSSRGMAGGAASPGSPSTSGSGGSSSGGSGSGGVATRSQAAGAPRPAPPSSPARGAGAGAATTGAPPPGGSRAGALPSSPRFGVGSPGTSSGGGGGGGGGAFGPGSPTALSCSTSNGLRTPALGGGGGITSPKSGAAAAARAAGGGAAAPPPAKAGGSGGRAVAVSAVAAGAGGAAKGAGAKHAAAPPMSKGASRFK